LGPIISINTLIFHGHDFQTAIDEIAKQGTQHIELAFMVNYYPELDEQTFTLQYARELNRMIRENGLNSTAFSAHMDLGTDQCVTLFKKRMEFAKALGTGKIITNTCQNTEKSQFLKNVEALVQFAESLDLVICLENPGSGRDILFESGSAFAPIVDQIDSEYLAINYDFANVFSYSRQRILPEEDLPPIQSKIKHTHIKDLQPESWGWRYSEIGRGVINYPAILSLMSKWDPLPPMSIELPVRFHMDRDSNFIVDNLPPPMPLEEIGRILTTSIQYLRNKLGAQPHR
jgi:sugar phosphate isomerase/epimerase